jgi:NAD(P)-dependent dehydrogenase (short-subunit alcohol dehydrogenase family)
MKILVTGGMGNIGRSLVQHLLSRGHEVKALDRQMGDGIEGAACAACDMTDFAAVREQVRGQQAIIHLAALTYPGAGAGNEIFRINCAGTFNVYEAAAQEGIRRVVCASSINALGFNFGVKSFPMAYFPIDEAHPTFTTDAYSFSKQIVEEIGAYYWRREGITGVCLRLPWVVPPITAEWREMVDKYMAGYRQAIGDLLNLHPDEQRQRVDTAIQKYDEMRARREFEKPWNAEDGGDGWENEDPHMMLLAGFSDFWSIITMETTVHAFERGVSADYEGCHALFVCERNNSVGVESEKLARLFFPGVPHKIPLVGTETLVSYEKARRLIGFEPPMGGS